MFQKIVGELKSLYSQPYASNMNLGSWFMFIGIILCCIILWTRVLHAVHLTR